jgi:hypothetical protein
VRRLILGALIWLLAVGCEDTSYRSIGAEIRTLIRDTAGAEEAAVSRLGAFGRRAIPQIEIALHTAPERGRLRLFATLERIGDAEAIPILRHFAVYDGSAAVREALEAVLVKWGAASDPRSERARQALDQVRESRAMGEGPLPPRVSR